MAVSTINCYWRSGFAGEKIIVAGAGISGLPFTLALRRLWLTNLTPPNITIYERDSNIIPAGREGYTLSLARHGETGGLFTARDLGILDDLMKHAVQGLGNKFQFTLCNASWSELLNRKFEPAPGLPTSGIRIARKHIRKVLTDSENNLTAECELLIICDGASSKLRASGLAIFSNGMLKPVNAKWIMMLSYGKGVACFLSPYDETSVSWDLSYRAPSIEGPLKMISIEDAQEVIDEYPKLMSRLAARDKQPFSHDISLGPAILIGDSTMNLAMRDGWDLTPQLCRSHNLEDAVLKESCQRIDMSHTTGFSYSKDRSLLSIAP
ncbi:hypothetical protein ACQKWADRAFT_322706 [Trichoderma austrokoningii]